ncbi:MAG: hypothetical protein WB779_13130, partial [Ignavibacteriaceae bacterium]
MTNNSLNLVIAVVERSWDKTRRAFSSRQCLFLNTSETILQLHIRSFGEFQDARATFLHVIKQLFR